jgi:hypothetical protein
VLGGGLAGVLVVHVLRLFLALVGGDGDFAAKRHPFALVVGGEAVPATSLLIALIGSSPATHHLSMLPWRSRF